MPDKPVVAILYGGYSTEAHISKLSALNVFDLVDTNNFEPYLVKLNKEGFWLHPNPKSQINIKQTSLKPLSFQIDYRNITIDTCLNIIHGSPGEDGRLQGYLEGLDIPFTGSGLETMSLTFNKFQCNNYLQTIGINTAKSVIISNKENVANKINTFNLPIFIKPNAGGSSFGITKVITNVQIESAIKYALDQSEFAIIEEYLDGTEITIGVTNLDNKVIALPPTEIISENEFFDYQAKYEGKSIEITPARIDKDLTDKAQAIAIDIYQKLNCRGIIRIDMMIVANKIYIIEVNTIPGFTDNSLVPQQLEAAGIDSKTVISQMIEESLGINN